jgi:phosphoribosyl-ATP pyrophosphohydrolase/phosphoribosyl-AMP cyclohydrolase
MNVRDILVDCDGDTLLVKVDPAGPACHTGQPTCFHRYPHCPSDASWHRGEGEAEGLEVTGPAAGPPGKKGILSELFGVILDRQTNRPTGSYTAELLDAGEDEILKKVGEEAIELILAAKGQGDQRLVSEIADLTYHLLVLLAARGLDLADVRGELARRRR